jgi:hypothetical protein
MSYLACGAPAVIVARSSKNDMRCAAQAGLQYNTRKKIKKGIVGDFGVGEKPD